MNTPLILVSLSGFVVLASYVVARAVQVTKRPLPKSRQGILDCIGSLFALALFVFVDSLSYVVTGQALITSDALGLLFLVGCFQGIVYEYVGQFTCGVWHYPSVNKRRWLLWLLPLFWGIFMLVMQDTYHLLSAIGLNELSALFATGAIQFLLIEGINLATGSWVYTGWGKPAIVLFIGWLLLAFTFVYGFNHLFYNPFLF